MFVNRTVSTRFMIILWCGEVRRLDRLRPVTMVAEAYIADLLPLHEGSAMTSRYLFVSYFSCLFVYFFPFFSFSLLVWLCIGSFLLFYLIFSSMFLAIFRIFCLVSIWLHLSIDLLFHFLLVEVQPSLYRASS